jgi:hypothetical protein
MFGFLKHVVHAVTHFVKKHVATIASLAASTLVFAGVLGLSIVCPFAIPAIAALAAAGFASGATYYGVSNLLSGRSVSLQGFLWSGLTSTAVTVATAGTAELLAPVASRVLAPLANALPRAVAGAVPGAARAAVGNASAGAAFGAGARVAENAVGGRPLGRGVGGATALGAVSGAFVGPANRLTTSIAAEPAAAEPVAADPGPRPQQPLIDHEVAAGRYEPDRVFQDYIPRGIPSEGWKLHVSADPESAGEVAAVALPVLREMGVAHKVVGTVDDYVNVMTGTQTGKLVTIYPDDPTVARAVVDRLDPLLAARGFKGPVVEGEMPLGSSGLIYGRYGGFTKGTVTDPSTGIEVRDVRGQVSPPWIENPFLPSSPSESSGLVGALDHH